MELAQLWRCPVTWCTVWKVTAQDCVDHMRRTHDVPPLVKAANLARYFPPWTVTREQWTNMTLPTISGVAIDTLLFSRIGVPLFHRYRIISRSGTNAAFRGTYMRRLHAFLEESVRRHHRRCAKELFFKNTFLIGWYNWLTNQNSPGCSHTCMWEHSCSHPSSKRTLSLECCSQSRVGENLQVSVTFRLPCCVARMMTLPLLIQTRSSRMWTYRHNR